MAKMYRVYSIIERPKQEDFWLNIGVAFPHEKGDGFNIMLQALPLWLLAAPVPARALGTALVVSGLANGLVNPTIHSLFTLRPPPAVRAKVITASYTASTLAAPAALLVAGPALSAFGSRAVLGAAAGGQTVAVLLITVSSLRERAIVFRG